MIRFDLKELQHIYNIGWMSQEDRCNEVTQSQIVIDERMIVDARKLCQKTRKQMQFARIVGVVLFLAVFAILFKISSDINTGNTKTLGIEKTQLQNEQRRLRDDLAALKTKIASLEANLSASMQEVTLLKGKILTKNVSSELNTAQLTEYVKQGFSKFQADISFVHMHNSETYFYQRVNNHLRYLQTDFLKQNDKARTAFMLAANNYKLPHTNAPFKGSLDSWLWKDYERLSKEYDFSLPELSFCIVVPTLNNAKNFRYEYNLQSMVNLDYKNFKIVIVDDASTDNTYELIKIWIEQNGISNNIVVLKNEQRMTALPNIHKAITQHCSADSIVVLVDGDDELLGRYSLKVFNHIYHKQKADVVYSNHIQLRQTAIFTHIGWSMNYSDEQKRNFMYREVPQRIAHLRSFKTKLYLNIKEADLKDDQGKWLTSAYDEAICLPILEMSCGRIVYVQEYFYLYNFMTGSNDLQIDGKLQNTIGNYVRGKAKYPCVNE